jgi:hypothetical protein
MVVRLSGLRAGCSLPPGRFLVLIYVRSLIDPKAIVWLEKICQLTIPNDRIGNRTRDLLSCSIVPQPTMLPHEPPCRINRAQRELRICNIINNNIFVGTCTGTILKKFSRQNTGNFLSCCTIGSFSGRTHLRK